MTKKEDNKKNKKLGVIYYEVLMFCKLNNKLKNNFEDNIIKNALIESFLVHCRNLMYFLKNRDDDGIKRKEFKNKNDKSFNQSLEIGSSNCFADKISAYTTHVLNSRTLKKKPDWYEKFSETIKQIKEELCCFFDDLSPKYSIETLDGEVKTKDEVLNLLDKMNITTKDSDSVSLSTTSSTSKS